MIYVLVILERLPAAAGSRTRNPAMWGSTAMADNRYILPGRKDGSIYLGATNDIVRCVHEHRRKAVPGFTSKDNITPLVWLEICKDPAPILPPPPPEEKEAQQL